jgi:hypothetical protein
LSCWAPPASESEPVWFQFGIAADPSTPADDLDSVVRLK